MTSIASRCGFAVLAALTLFTAFATKVLAADTINLEVAASWGEPEFSQYTALNKTSEWETIKSSV